MTYRIERAIEAIRTILPILGLQVAIAAILNPSDAAAQSCNGIAYQACPCDPGPEMQIILGEVEPADPRVCDLVKVHASAFDIDEIGEGGAGNCIDFVGCPYTACSTSGCIDGCIFTEDGAPCTCWLVWTVHRDGDLVACSWEGGGRSEVYTLYEPQFCPDRPGTYIVRIWALEDRPLPNPPPGEPEYPAQYPAACYTTDVAPTPDHACGCGGESAFVETTVEIPPPEVEAFVSQNVAIGEDSCDDGDYFASYYCAMGICGGACCNSLIWSIDSPSLGARILPSGQIIPGDQEGYITVRGTFSNQSGPYAQTTAEVRIGHSDGCSTGLCGLGGAALKADGPELRIDVGRGNDNKPLGELRFHATAPSSQISTPVALAYHVKHPDVTVARDSSGVLSSIETPDRLVNVRTISDYEYAIDIRDVATGPSGDPDVTWRIHNPDEGASTSRLHVTKIVNGETAAIFKYSYSVPENEWTLDSTSPAGAVLKREKVKWTGNVREYRAFDIEGENEVLVYRDEETYADYGFGKVLVTRVLDPGTPPDHANLTTTRTFYTNPSEPGKYGRLKSIENPDGSWKWFDYDECGRRIKVVESWLDEAMPANPGHDGSHVTEYAYPTCESSTIVDMRPTAIVETVNSAEIRRTYYEYEPENLNEQIGATRIVEQATVPQAPLHAATNLKEKTTYELGKDTLPAMVEYPDGRVDVYAHTDVGFTPNESDPGNPSYAGPLHRKVTIDHGYLNGSTPEFIDGKSTRSVIVTTLSGTEVFEELYVRANNAWERIEWTASILDGASRIRDIYRSNGAHVSNTWQGCCGQRTTTDEAGTTTVETYDAIGRLIESKKVGVAADETNGYESQPDTLTEHVYDAAGHLLSTTTTGGTAGSQLTQTSARQFDLAGRVETSSQPGTSDTAYDYASTPEGGRRVTVTRPGGATEVTEYYRDGRIKSVTGSGVIARYYRYGVGFLNGIFTLVYYGADESARWEKTHVDMAGRELREDRPGAVPNSQRATEYFYNDKGQLIRRKRTNFVTTFGGGGGGGPGQGQIIYNAEEGVFVDVGTGQPRSGDTTATDGADVLYAYDDLGNLNRTCVNTSGDPQNPAIDLDSDRVSETDTLYVKEGDIWWRETREYVYPVDGSTTKVLVSRERQQMTGLPLSGGVTSVEESVDISGNVTCTQRVLDAAAHLAMDITDTPDSITDSINVTRNGLTVRTVSASGVTHDFRYDALGRQVKSRDKRHEDPQDPEVGWAETHYNVNGQVDWVKDAAGYQTSYSYDPATGRLKSIANANGKKTYYAYDDHGRTIRIWGDVPQPVEFEYDANYGERKKLKTFRGGTGWNHEDWPGTGGNTGGGTGTADVTTWNYQAATGLMISKQYAAPINQVTYTYEVGGALAKRKWARGAFTEYEYDPGTGELTKVDHWESNPDVIYTYDRIGRVETITDTDGTMHTFQYDATTLLPTTESIDGLYNVQVTRTYESSQGGRVPGRASGFTIGDASDPDALYATTWGYDAYGRLNSVTGPGLPPGGAVYGYEPDSDLVSETSFRDAQEVPIAWTVKLYEARRDFVTDIFNAWGEFGESEVSHYAYATDGLGRRTSVVRTGSAFEGTVGDHQEHYGYNDRNELISAATYLGADLEDPQGEVVARKRGYDYDPIGNRKTSTVWGGDPVTPTVTTYTTNNVNQYTGTTNPTETFTHDLDGNLTGDADNNYYWDNENRLWFVIPKIGGEGKVKLEFNYDYQNRRKRKRVYPWDPSANGGAGDWAATATQDLRFVYDGWNLVMELDGMNGDAVIRKYAWGLDMSGTMQGAGGIGGLLAVEDANNTPSNPADDLKYLYFVDANGNVGQLIDWQESIGDPVATIAARYEYDPYGNGLLNPPDGSQGGPYANVNSFGFSGKYRDSETEWRYYGYRYLDSVQGRWTARDPLEEAGDLHIYQFVKNRPCDAIDALGKQTRMADIVLKNVDRRGALTAVIHADVWPPPCCRLVRWIQLIREQVWQYAYSDSGWVLDSNTWTGLPPYLPWYSGRTHGPENRGRFQRWTLEDAPGLKRYDYVTQAFIQDFETCAVCLTGSGGRTTGCIIGCVRWGHNWVRGNPDYHTFYSYVANAPSGNMASVLLQFAPMWNGFVIRLSCP